MYFKSLQRLGIGAAVLFFLIIQLSLAGACNYQNFPDFSDPALTYNCSDSVLVARYINPFIASKIATGDSTLSDIWTNGFCRDSVVFSPAKNSYPGRDSWSGEHDARGKIKALFSDSGLLLLIEIEDDDWVDVADAEAATAVWQYDMFMVSFDRYSREELDTLGTEHFILPAYGWAYTFESVGFHCPWGSGAQPSFATLNYYDNTFFKWGWQPPRFDFHNSIDPFYGMRVEVHEREQGAKRIVEWFFPIALVGNNFGSFGNPVDFSSLDWPLRSAFSFSYADRDSGEDTVSMLCWRNFDPYRVVHSQNGDSISPEALHAWGNIEFSTLTPARNHYTRRENKSFLPPISVQKEYYTLLGARIRKADLKRSGAIPNSVIVEHRPGHSAYTRLRVRH